jgi:hypothetical protein
VTDIAVVLSGGDFVDERLFVGNAALFQDVRIVDGGVAVRHLDVAPTPSGANSVNRLRLNTVSNPSSASCLRTRWSIDALMSKAATLATLRDIGL